MLLSAMLNICAGCGVGARARSPPARAQDKTQDKISRAQAAALGAAEFTRCRRRWRNGAPTIEKGPGRHHQMTRSSHRSSSARRSTITT